MFRRLSCQSSKQESSDGTPAKNIDNATYDHECNFQVSAPAPLNIGLNWYEDIYNKIGDRVQLDLVLFLRAQTGTISILNTNLMIRITCCHLGRRAGDWSNCSVDGYLPYEGETGK